MNRYFLLIIITISLLAGSCAGRRNKVEHKAEIPEKDLVRILTEIHIADGLLTLPRINYLYSDRDTISAYVDIIEKHGYTKEEMDRTMQYYFIEKPKKMIRIYDKVLGALSEMESRIDREMPVSGSGEPDFWQGKSSYYFPDPTGRDTSWFDIPLNIPGRYNLKFTLTIYPDDQSSDPHPGIYYTYTDSTGSAERNYISDFPYLKNGQPHNFSFTINLIRMAPARLMGWFVDQEKQSPSLIRHLRIEKVMLTRTPN